MEEQIMRDMIDLDKEAILFVPDAECSRWAFIGFIVGLFVGMGIVLIYIIGTLT